MNIPQVFDWRSKRNLNPVIQTMNYSTYSLPDFTENKNMKDEFYDMYSPDMKEFSEMATEKKIDEKNERSEPWLIKSALHMCAMIYRKISGRASSPDLSYHDCESPGHEAQTSLWHRAKTENKNIEAHTAGLYTDADMSGDYKSVVASCEDKLNKVRQLITSKPAPSSPKCTTTTYRSRRRRRQFVEANSVEDSFEDAFCPEDFISESNSDTLAFIIPYQYQNCEIYGIDAPKMKIEKSVDIKSQVPEHKEDLNVKPDVVKTEVVEHNTDQPVAEEKKTNIETVSSCESKIMQLQAMLKERRKKNTKTMLNSSDSVSEPVKDLSTEQTKAKFIPAPKTQDKRYKNRHRLSTGKRKKAETKQLIQDDMLFADEIAETPSSFENSPIIRRLVVDKSPSLSLDKSPLSITLDKSVESLGVTPTESLGVTPTEDCFDEVAGRFRSASGTESDDSFQVVFTDSPRAMRPSDCESEDSFIFFEDSPDSCYTSNDVFGEESESEYSDTDSEISDSGCGDSDELKMSHNMTKTFEDLTDDRLYEENKDVVDSAVKMCVEIPNDDLDLDSVSEVKSTGLLLDDAKKLMRKDRPAKKVHFSEKPPKVHVMRVWAFAARQARAGHWERHALDRERFKRRIADADMALSWVLKPQHRSRVMFQRFMPWWNAQRRKEIAEKKARQEEEKIRLEEERINEEQRIEQERKEAEENKGIGEENDGEQHGDNEEITKVGEKNSEDQRINDEIAHTETKDSNVKVALLKVDTGTEKDDRNIQKKILNKEEVRTQNKIDSQGHNKDIHKNIEDNDKLKGSDDKHNVKNEIKNSAIVLNGERTNIKDLNVTNTLKSVPNNINQKKVNMEIILKEDKCLIPLTVNTNKAVS